MEPLGNKIDVPERITHAFLRQRGTWGNSFHANHFTEGSFFVKEADELCKSLFQMAYFSQHVAQSWNYVDLKLFDDLGLIISCLKT